MQLNETTINNKISELEDATSEATVMLERRKELVEELSELDEKICVTLGIKPVITANEGESLINLLIRIAKITGRPMTRDEWANAVLKAGYKTTSSNFVDVVTSAINVCELFEAVPNTGRKYQTPRQYKYIG